MYCKQPTRCLCRIWCLSQCNNWVNGPNKDLKNSIFPIWWPNDLNPKFGWDWCHTCDTKQKCINNKTDVFPQTLAGKVKTRKRSGWTRLWYISRSTTKPKEWCALSEVSDQPGQPPNLFRVVAFLRTQSFIRQTANSDQTGRMPWLIWVFAARTCHFVDFVMRRLISRCAKPKPKHVFILVSR